MSARAVPLFAANWKMYKSPPEARAFLEAFLPACPPRPDRRILVFPSAVSLEAVAGGVAERTDIAAGVQDVHEEAEGAHTGSVSAAMAAGAGATWALAGHSERRREFGDDDGRVVRKVGRILEAGLRPLVCVGETLAEREAGQLEQVLVRQVGAVLGAVGPAAAAGLTWAYEPVWAIGTGRTASPSDAAGAHGIVRGVLADSLGADAAGAVAILYGGSVKPANIAELMAADGVDGVLVGGASLDPAAFAAICSVTLPPR
ncbi:MAG: triose-phosphate isomerase [Gemmatimonadota bacterium]|nr:triose-phosphate isomerase [Gemmatimonadota bacterium]